MLEKILVATDFSVAARRAVMRAALLAKHKDAELTLLHVLPERGFIARVFHRNDIDYAAMAAGAERTLNVEIETVQTHTGVTARPFLLEGLAHRVIAAAASQLGATLVVIGAHGERESAHASRYLGGTALKCFARTTIPLLLVRGAVEGNYYKVLAAIDGSSESERVLAAAVEVTGSRAICQVLHAFDVPFAERLRGHEVKEETIAAYAAEEHGRSERTVKELLAAVPGSSRITPIVLRGSTSATLLREIRERGPDLVIVGKRRSISDLDPHPFGSVSLRVALETPGDVLVIP